MTKKTLHSQSWSSDILTESIRTCFFGLKLTSLNQLIWIQIHFVESTTLDSIDLVEPAHSVSILFRSTNSFGFLAISCVLAVCLIVLWKPDLSRIFACTDTGCDDAFWRCDVFILFMTMRCGCDPKLVFRSCGIRRNFSQYNVLAIRRGYDVKLMFRGYDLHRYKSMLSCHLIMIRRCVFSVVRPILE